MVKEKEAPAEVFEIEKIEVSQLPELQGLVDKQKKIVAENPFLEIVDNATYTTAKKHRTALLSARTEVQRQEKMIDSKIKSLRDLVSEKTKELIMITQPAEIKQQAEVKRYEAEKQAEKDARDKAESERIDALKKEWHSIVTSINGEITTMTFETKEAVNNFVTEQSEILNADKFNEFREDIKMDCSIIERQLLNVVSIVDQKEEQRLRKIELDARQKKLDDEKAAQELKKKADDEKLASDQKKLDDAKKKLDAAKKKIADKRKADLKKIADQKIADQKAIDDKAKADQKIIDDAKAEAEIKAREKALAPDKENLIEFIRTLKFEYNTPAMKDKALEIELNKFIETIDKMKTTFIDSINRY